MWFFNGSNSLLLSNSKELSVETMNFALTERTSMTEDFR